MKLRVTCEKLEMHIDYVRQFCSFIEEQRVKWQQVSPVKAMINDN